MTSPALVATVIALVLGFASPDALDAAARRWVPVAGKSEVAFTAGFPLGTFTGRGQDPTGEFEADPADLRQGIRGVLRVRVMGLQTGNPGRDRDMYRTLAAERYPEVRFTVERVDPSFPSVTERADVLLTIRGLMSIRGVERAMAIPGRVRLRDERLWVRGETALRMSDFGVQAPSRFLLKVKDTVQVSFDITLAAE